MKVIFLKILVRIEHSIKNLKDKKANQFIVPIQLYKKSTDTNLNLYQNKTTHWHEAIATDAHKYISHSYNYGFVPHYANHEDFDLLS